MKERLAYVRLVADLLPLGAGLALEEAPPAEALQLAARASADQLEKIQRIAPGIKADRVHIRRIDPMANDQPSRDGRVEIERAALQALVPMYLGQPLMRNHMTYASEDLPVGVVFDTSAGVRPDGTFALAGEAYFAKTPTGNEIVENIDVRVYREVSIAVFFASMCCSVCGVNVLAEYCEHAIGKEYGGKVCRIRYGNPRVVDELSIVWKGRLVGTQMFKARFPNALEAEDVLTLRADPESQAFKPDSWRSALKKLEERPPDAPTTWRASLKAHVPAATPPTPQRRRFGSPSPN